MKETEEKVYQHHITATEKAVSVLEDSFEAEGLDAHDYALISLEDDTEQTETGMQKTGTQTYNVNYVDLLAFIISAV